jgi:aspartyl-tRNA(Asn)/glutamyl-tRNA(Gln) amidotransferase subunit A
MQETRYTYLDSSPLPASADGALSGTSVAIQPNMSVRGWPTSAGSKALEGFTAIYDATVIERLKHAGAHIKGSIRMSELGFGLAGDTGATVLDDDDVDCLLITDTMGEARMTACLSGDFGFKPSYGRVSRFGLIGLIPSMECYGIAAKNIKNIAGAMSVMAKSDSRDLSMPALDADLDIPGSHRRVETLEPIRSCGMVKACIDMLGNDESRAFSTAMARLADHGIQIEKVHLKDFELAREVHNVMGAVEASSSAGKYDGVRYGHRTATAKNWNDMYMNSRGESFGVLVKTYLFQGAYFQYENYDAFVDAARIRARLLAQTEAALEHFDVLVLPTRRAALDPSSAHTINTVYDVFSWTLLANITGHPAISLPGMVPCGDTDLGLQLIGPRFQDERLLSMAARLTDLNKEAHHHGL